MKKDISFDKNREILNMLDSLNLKPHYRMRKRRDTLKRYIIMIEYITFYGYNWLY
jgi:hypothetical protein